MHVKRAVAAGLIGTAAMTMLMLVGPLMGFPPMPIGKMLGGFLGIGDAAGWAMHVLIGVTLALGYALIFTGRLPSPTVLSGMIYGFLVFLVAQIVVTPLMGGGVFSGGNIPMIVGSLMGHLVYGGLVGVTYGLPEPRRLAATT
jgi:hypothetical protein